MTNTVAFGRAVRLLREESEMTQTELATLAGTTRATVANVELLRHPASTRTRYRLARALGFDPVTLELAAATLFLTGA